MNSPFTLPACFFLGAVLSAFYFGGLWLTVKRLPQSRQPTLLSLSSFAARSLVAVTGGAGTVDFLAFFEVDRDRRSGHEQRREQQEYKSIEHHSRPPNNSMRRIVARLAASEIDANHA